MRLLTVPEVSLCLSVRPSRVYGLIRAGVLPAVRVGRQVRVLDDDLRQWIAKGGRPLDTPTIQLGP